MKIIRFAYIWIMQRFFPFLDWGSKYQKGFFAKDLVAGLTVGIVLIPQGMAYAMIAGLPPVYGLYASLFPLVVYLFLGTSRELAIGPVAMDSLLVAAGLGALALTDVESYIAMAIFLAFLVGAIQVLLGLFRMGFLVNFLSKPVISGFTSGAAFIIVFSQLHHLLGVDIEKSNKFHQLIINAFGEIHQTNGYDLAIGIGRQSRMILDNLGIILDLDKTYGDYAETIGKTTDEFTEMDKKMALTTAIIEDSQGLIKAQVFLQETQTEKLQRLGAS